MALGSTQPLTEMTTMCFPGGKGGRCVRLTTLPPSCTVVMKFGNLNFLEPSGPLQACNGTALLFFILLLLSVYCILTHFHLLRAWMVNASPRPLYSLERNPVPTLQVWWAPVSVWTSVEQKKFLLPHRGSNREIG